MASGSGVPSRFRLSSPLRPATGGSGSAASTPAGSSYTPFNRRGPPGPTPPLARPSILTRRTEEEKQADELASASASMRSSHGGGGGGGGGWQGGPLQPNIAGETSMISSSPPSRFQGHTAVLAPLQSAQGTGLEISAEIDSLRLELQELRLSNNSLQQTNQELHAALAQVTERSKLLSTEHARFLEEFREKSHRSKQKLMNDRASLKLNLADTNTRLEEIERLNATIEDEKSAVVEKHDALIAEHDALVASFADLQREKQIWLSKESEYLEIQAIQTRNLDELNQTVLQIQSEREGWHQRYEETQGELYSAQQHAASLEQTIQSQETTITQLNGNLLTSQEEIMNLTQTLATHLEQIASISKQNQDLHATLVQFTRTSDRDYLADAIQHADARDNDATAARTQRIDFLQLDASMSSPRADPTLSPAFHGPIPQTIHSPAFLSPAKAHPTPSASTNAAHEFLHTASGLSTLHLPASFLTSKLSSYTLWVLEHKQILENMVRRKEKLRQELEEQIVVANVEAKVNATAAAEEELGSPMRSSGGRASPIGSPQRLGASSPSAPFSPTRSTLLTFADPTAGVTSSSLLLPSLLQHTLHDLHELTHLTRHDALQLESFEREKAQILSQCSTHGFNNYNAKRTKNAWNVWVATLNHRIHRRQTLHRLLQRAYLRQIAHSFGQFRQNVTLHFTRTQMRAHQNEMHAKVIAALVGRTELASSHAQQVAFLRWRTTAHRHAFLRKRLVRGLIAAVSTDVAQAWSTWKANVLKLRHRATVIDSGTSSEEAAARVRARQLEQLQRMVARRMHTSEAQRQRLTFLAWRSWSRTRRAMKRTALRRIAYICCGEGTIAKAWHRWKEFRAGHHIAAARTQLIRAHSDADDRFDRQRENFLVGYSRLRDRFQNLQVLHWWRLAYVDTQWLKREDQWRRALTAHKQMQVRTLISHHREVGCMSAFLAWRQMSRARHNGKARSAGKILQRLLQSQLQHGFRRWLKHTEDARVRDLRTRLGESERAHAARKQQFIVSLVAKWRRHHLTTAFNRFRDQVRAKKARKREILDRTLRRLHHTHTWAAFRQWQTFCERAQSAALQARLREQKGKFASVILQRVRLGCLVPAFAAWRHRVAAAKHHRVDILDRTVKKLLHSSLWRALRRWKRFTEQHSVAELKSQMAGQLTAHTQWRVTQLIQQSRLSTLVPAFAQWRTFILLRHKKKRDLLDRTCRRLEHATLWKAFRTWTSFTEKTATAELRSRMQLAHSQASEQRTKMAAHMLIKWRTTREKAKFIAWRTYTSQSRANKRRVLERMVQRLTACFVDRAFGKWRQFAESSRLAEVHASLNEHKSRTAHQAVLKWRHRILTTPFINWRNHVRKRRAHKRAVLDRMVRRLTQLSVYRAFRTWTDFIDRTKVALMRQKFLAVQSDLHSQIADHKLKRIQTMVARWRGASLSTRFQQWRLFSRTQRQKKKARLRQILDRMASSSVWRAWRQWTAYVTEHRAHQARLASEGAIMELHRQTSVAAQTVRQKHILTKTLDRMANLLLFSGWRGWVEFTAASRAHDITKQKQRLEAQTAHLQRQQAEMVRAHSQYNLERKQQIVDKTLRRIAYANVYKALRVWKKETERRAVVDMHRRLKSKENALKAKLVVTRISHHRRITLQPLMHRWRKFAQAQRARKRELLERTAKRLMNLMLWKSLRHWKQIAQVMAVDAMRAAMEAQLTHQKQQRVVQLVRSWRHRSIMPVFTAWRAYRQQSQQRKQRLAAIFARLEQIKAYKSFRRWQAYHRGQRQQEQLQTRQRVMLDRVVKRVNAAVLSHALHTWVAHTDAHRHDQRTQREQQMVQEMAHFRKCDLLDRTYRRITAASLWKALHQWRTYILRSRLIVNDKLGEYSEMILSLRRQSEADAVRLHEAVTENQKLKSNILSIKHRQHTLSLMSDQQKENRAILFAYNTILAKSFRAFYQRVHALKRRKLTLHKTCQHIRETSLMRAMQQWRAQTMEHRSQMMQHALDTAKKQLDHCLGQVWRLESQLTERTAEAETAAAESEQLRLNAQAQEMNHQLEKQMPNEREVALAREVDTLAAKLELLLKEVRQRGEHIQFLSAENQRLSGIVKTTGPISVGFPSPAASASNSAIHNHTLNLSTSFARSRGAAPPSASAMTTGTPATVVDTRERAYRPASSFGASASSQSGATGALNATNPRATATSQFFPQTNVSFGSSFQ